MVGDDQIPTRFFNDERSSTAGIRITDQFSRLAAGEQANNLSSEAEARWRLVETAWELGVSRNIVVQHDPGLESLFTVDRSLRRKSITNCKDAISGYQNGRCFYCNEQIQLSGQTHVDHFFAHALKGRLGPLVDGIWNLVLSCIECNAGVGGKFDKVPTLFLLERLSERNEYFIASHHPLRETLLAQTGAHVDKRRDFLNRWHTEACTYLIHQWEPKKKAPSGL